VTISPARQVAVLRACEVVGGMDELALRLRISRPALMAMASGRIDVPQRIFFALVDIIAMQSAPDPARRRGTADPSDSLDKTG
jgi:hypothetical protein